MKEGLVGGQGFAVDASLISADVQKQNSSNPEDWATRVADADDAPRAVQEHLDTLDDEAFGAATTTEPKFTAHADLASQWTAVRKGPAFFAYSTNYLIDTDHSIIVDVDASRSNRTAEVGAMRKMIDRTEESVLPSVSRRGISIAAISSFSYAALVSAANARASISATFRSASATAGR
jgi:hypothetical protein